MKRKLISWLLAIACCISLLPSNLVLAAENTGEISPSTTTVAYFTNLADYPQSSSYAQAVTVTGAALTEVGGKTRWDYGLIIIEPKEGYTFDKAWYSSSNGTQEVLNADSNVEKVLQELAIANIPVTVTNAIKDKTTCKAIKIDSVLFNTIRYKTIYLSFKQINTGNTVQQILRVKSNEITATDTTVSLEQQFDLFDDILGKDIQSIRGNNWSKNDFDINIQKYTGSGYSGVSENIVIKDETETGKYSISQTGRYSFMLTDKKNGLRYFAYVNVTFGENAPLKEGNITVSENATINYNNLSQGMITVQPKDKKELAMKNIKFSFNLPEEADIAWNSVAVNNKVFPLEVNKECIWSKKVSDTLTIPFSFFVTEVNKKQELSITSEYAIDVNINININYQGQNYTYSIAFQKNQEVGMMGGQKFFVQPNETRNIFEILSTEGTTNKNEIEEIKQRFIGNVKSGRYTLTIPGVDPESLKKEKFDGNVCFSSSGTGAVRIYDNILMTQVNGWGLTVVMQIWVEAEYDVNEAKDNVNKENKDSEHPKNDYSVKLEDYEDYIEIKLKDENLYEIKPTDEIDYITENQSIKAKPENAGKEAKGTVDIIQKSDNRILAELAIHFAPIIDDDNIQDNRNKNLIKAIESMPKEGGKAVFFSMTNYNRAEISTDVLNALIASASEAKDGKGNRLVIMLKSSSGNKVEWDFNSANMKNSAKKNIVLNVQVGDKVENTGINKILEETKETGLKIGFWDNGELPGETQVRLYLSDEEAKILEGNTYEKAKISDEDTNNIYLYYYNPSTQRLVKERSNLYINSTPNNKKYISIPVTHNSDFVLSTASDLDKNTSSNSGIILGGGTSIVYTPAPTATVAPTPIPTATPTTAPTTTPAPTSTVVPTAAPTITPAPTAAPTVVPIPEPTITPAPTVKPSVKNKVKKVKAVKKKVTIQKNKKVNVNFKVTTTNNKKVVKDKVKVTVKNKKVAKVMKTKVKVGKAIVIVKGLKKGKTILKVNIAGKTAKTTLKIR